MEFLSPEFFYALAAIVMIDLVLAGDNAIVIALAARNVPVHLRKRAIFCGALGAIVVRSALTVVVVWLLKIPGLMAAGGLMLVWIAYKLLLPEDDHGEAHVKPADSFWGALKTIVVADTVMGLDNVLAVGGAAHGSFLLVVLGLLISVPLIIWGSTLLLGFVERFPAFVYAGAAVLAVTAVRMITTEPLVASALQPIEPLIPALYVLVVGGVLWAGFLKNHRRLESRITARLAEMAQQRAQSFVPPPTVEVAEPGGLAMPNVLVPVDASANALRAVDHVIGEARKDPALLVHLLNVQPPFSRHVARFIARKSRADYHNDQSAKVLEPMKKKLADAGVACTTHAAVGDKARVITQAASRLHCDHIVMSTARKNSLTRMIEDSVTNRVLELTPVPVEVIAGNAVSRLERFGIPAGVGAALGFLVLAAAD